MTDKITTHDGGTLEIRPCPDSAASAVPHVVLLLGLVDPQDTRTAVIYLDAPALHGLSAAANQAAYELETHD